MHTKSFSLYGFVFYLVNCYLFLNKAAKTSGKQAFKKDLVKSPTSLPKICLNFIIESESSEIAQFKMLKFCKKTEKNTVRVIYVMLNTANSGKLPILWYTQKQCNKTLKSFCIVKQLYHLMFIFLNLAF